MNWGWDCQTATKREKNRQSVQEYGEEIQCEFETCPRQRYQEGSPQRTEWLLNGEQVRYV